MEGVIIDYHIIFIMISFIMFLITFFLLFIGGEPTKNELIGSMILTGINMNFCWFNMLSFFAINIYGFSGAGELVANPIAEMYPFFAVFLGLFFVNFGFFVYGQFLLFKMKGVPSPKKSF